MDMEYYADAALDTDEELLHAIEEEMMTASYYATSYSLRQTDFTTVIIDAINNQGYFDELVAAAKSYCNSSDSSPWGLSDVYTKVAEKMGAVIDNTSNTSTLTKLATLIRNKLQQPSLKLTISQITEYLQNSNQGYYLGWYLKCKGNTVYALEEDVFTVPGYTYVAVNDFASTGELKIPSTVNAQTITTIYDNACSNNQLLKKLVIPNSITKLGKAAFNNCTNLQKIELNAHQSLSLTPDDPTANTGANSVFKDIGTNGPGVELTVNGNVPDYLFKITSNSGFGRPFLTKVILTNKCTKIGRSAFAYCYALETINIPATVQTIGYAAFDNCSQVKFTFADRLIPGAEDTYYTLTLEKWAFNRCRSESFTTLPNGITSIPQYCFRDTDKAKNIILPKTVVSLATNVFTQGDENEYKQSVTLLSPNTVTINPNAFAGVWGDEDNKYFKLYYVGSLSLKPSNAVCVQIKDNLN